MLCRHVRTITPESIMEDFFYMCVHNGETNPAAFPKTEFVVDEPEKQCPDCGKIWRINE